VGGNTGIKPILDCEVQTQRIFGVSLGWEQEEGSLHRCYILGQCAGYSWCYYTGSPLSRLPEWEGITVIVAFGLHFCIEFPSGSPKVGFFHWRYPTLPSNPTRSPCATEEAILPCSPTPYLLTSVGAFLTVVFGVFNTPSGLQQFSVL